MALNLGVPRRCLICYGELDDSELTYRLEDQNSNAIFALKFLIRVSDYLLETFLQETRTSPGCWISLCYDCSGTVYNIKLMHQKIWEQQKTFKSEHEELLKTLRRSICYYGGLNHGSGEENVNEGSRSDNVGDVMKITKICRKVVNDRHGRGTEKGPLIVEDVCKFTQSFMERISRNKNDMCTGDFKKKMESTVEAESTEEETPIMDSEIKWKPQVAPVRGHQVNEGVSLTSLDQIDELSVSLQQRLNLRLPKPDRTNPKSNVWNCSKKGFGTKLNNKKETSEHRDGILAEETKKAKRDKRKSKSGNKGHKKALAKCKFCKLRFRTSSEMRKHRKLAHADMMHECVNCHKFFTSLDNLNAHRGTCERNNQPNEHSKAMMGYKPGQCHICGKQCKHQDDMNGHLKYVHMLSYEVVCISCGITLPTERQLKAHRKQSHGGVNTTGEEIYQCSVIGCGRYFLGNQRLGNHIAKVHGQFGMEQCFKCAYCGKEFQGKSRLREHEMTHKK